VSAVAFDNTMLSILLNPDGKPVYYPGTNSPVELARERAESVVADIEKARRKIILPAPALAELLTAIGPDAQQYLTIIGRSRVFEIGNFDARGAAELALLNRGVFAATDARDKIDPYQKRKVDRQILAICKVYGVTDLYTDDKGMASRARLCGIVPVSLSEIPIPDAARQHALALEPHEALPEPESDGVTPPDQDDLSDD
jgi:predicted nucleic acid-binding protein